eukprot:CAMPEP_0184027436 /NCGR_PEP_ID=MMETSP0954-20121128/14190_1 /TAXON_ID=627963 /ORGANISM="Aplanochytrium sp, Strain PBS07" /LENGTH=189 /DNA_ID=CAMNT_0026311981 /DNA_START=950 /DNA_END=1519 /DNA_ORIENTATION=+
MKKSKLSSSAVRSVPQVQSLVSLCKQQIAQDIAFYQRHTFPVGFTDILRKAGSRALTEEIVSNLTEKNWEVMPEEVEHLWERLFMKEFGNGKTSKDFIKEQQKIQQRKFSWRRCYRRYKKMKRRMVKNVQRKMKAKLENAPKKAHIKTMKIVKKRPSQGFSSSAQSRAKRSKLSKLKSEARALKFQKRR